MIESSDRYWALLSYNHRDEKWAAWLQRARESYRLPLAQPGKLLGIAIEARARSRQTFMLRSAAHDRHSGKPSEAKTTKKLLTIIVGYFKQYLI